MQTAIVTGAASGIGRALAEQLSQDGYSVHLADIAPTHEVAAQTDGTSHLLDVTDPDAVDRFADMVGDVDVICLNAGIVGTSLGPPWEASPEEWTRLLNVNLLGVVNGLRAFVPHLLESGKPASILITASLAGLLTFPGGGAYAATKHAVVAVAEQASLALRDTNVSVTLLCPALVRTAMSPVGDDPLDVAKFALNAVRSRRFLVAPDEWIPAIALRADRLVNGELPDIPAPG
jgi:NAD(P)-dependent dehydrogenase (short-subunit alcohol dehydrogenase family)